MNSLFVIYKNRHPFEGVDGYVPANGLQPFFVRKIEIFKSRKRADVAATNSRNWKRGIHSTFASCVEALTNNGAIRKLMTATVNSIVTRTMTVVTTAKNRLLIKSRGVFMTHSF